MSQSQPPETPHDPLTERVLKSELIFDGNVVHLYVDSVEFPNGKTGHREVIRHSGAVAIVPIDAKGNVVMVQQYRHAAGRVLIEVPAGTLNPGEDPDVCAVRELQEETGYRPGALRKIGGMFVAPGYTSEFIHLYLATDLVESRLAHDDDEFLRTLRLPMGEALKRITSGEIADGKSIAALLLAKELAGS